MRKQCVPGSPSYESLVQGYNATVKKNDGIKYEGVREEGMGRRKNEGQNKGRNIYEGPTTFMCEACNMTNMRTCD